jgi:hypothetical protein
MNREGTTVLIFLQSQCTKECVSGVLTGIAL